MSIPDKISIPDTYHTALSQAVTKIQELKEEPLVARLVKDPEENEKLRAEILKLFDGLNLDSSQIREINTHIFTPIYALDHVRKLHITDEKIIKKKLETLKTTTKALLERKAAYNTLLEAYKQLGGQSLKDLLRTKDTNKALNFFSALEEYFKASTAVNATPETFTIFSAIRNKNEKLQASRKSYVNPWEMVYPMSNVISSPEIDKSSYLFNLVERAVKVDQKLSELLRALGTQNEQATETCYPSLMDATISLWKGINLEIQDNQGSMRPFYKDV